MTKTLDLGCGTVLRNPFNADEFYGIDIREDLQNNIRQADLAIESIPFEDEFFDFVTAYDFIEHIPRIAYIPDRRNCFVEFMNEVYRVLKTDGYFLSFTPAFPRAEAFQDPTHVNIITKKTFSCYFDWGNRWASMYGFNGAFQVVFQEWRGPNLLTIMQKVDALEVYDVVKAQDAKTKFMTKLNENKIEVLKEVSGYYSPSFLKNVICRLKQLFF
jgi:SAM-dependent methyltransferase